MTHYEPLKHWTLNIITGNDAGLISATITERNAGDDEIRRADWHCRLHLPGAECAVIGRGQQLDPWRLQSLLTALHGLKSPAPPRLARARPAKTDYAPVQDDGGVKGIDFDNDPVWRAIAAIADGVEIK